MLWGGGYGVTQIPKGPENRWFDKWELLRIFKIGEKKTFGVCFDLNELAFGASVGFMPRR